MPNRPSKLSFNLGGQGPIKRTIRYLFEEHPAITLASLGIYASFLGLTHQFILLNHFNLNLSDYAEWDDFLIAVINLFYALRFFDLGVKEDGLVVGTFFISLMTVGFVFFYMNFTPPDDDVRDAAEVLTIIMFVVFFFGFPFALTEWLAKQQANEVLEGSTCTVKVKLRGDGNSVDVPYSYSMHFIDGLSSAYFVYLKPELSDQKRIVRHQPVYEEKSEEKYTGKAIVLPVVNVASIEFHNDDPVCIDNH